MPMQHRPKDLVSLAELSERMGVSSVSLHRYIHAGRLVPDYNVRRKNGSIQQHMFTKDHAAAVVAWWTAHQELEHQPDREEYEPNPYDGTYSED